jgi:hypothetical protein
MINHKELNNLMWLRLKIPVPLIFVQQFVSIALPIMIFNPFMTDQLWLMTGRAS